MVAFKFRLRDCYSRCGTITLHLSLLVEHLVRKAYMKFQSFEGREGHFICETYHHAKMISNLITTAEHQLMNQKIFPNMNIKIMDVNSESKHSQ